MDINVCFVPACTNAHYALGLCSTHYERHRAQKPRRLAWRKQYEAGAEFRKRTRKRANLKYATDPDFRKKYRKQTRDRARRKNGFTTELVEFLLDKQDAKCAICRIPIAEIGDHKGAGSINCDHCHVTNRPRGLLCRTCNLVLGKYEKFQKPAGLSIDPYDQYLERPPASEFAPDSP